MLPDLVMGVFAVGVFCVAWARAAAGLWPVVLANAGGGCRNVAQG